MKENSFPIEVTFQTDPKVPAPNFTFFDAAKNVGQLFNGLPPSVKASTNMLGISYGTFLAGLLTNSYIIGRIEIIGPTRLLRNPVSITHYDMQGTTVTDTETIILNNFQVITVQVVKDVFFLLDQTTIIEVGNLPKGVTMSYRFYPVVSYEKSYGFDVERQYNLPQLDGIPKLEYVEPIIINGHV